MARTTFISQFAWNRHSGLFRRRGTSETTENTRVFSRCQAILKFIKVVNEQTAQIVQWHEWYPSSNKISNLLFCGSWHSAVYWIDFFSSNWNCVLNVRLSVSFQELYRIIVSHARVVGACTRSSSRHQSSRTVTTTADSAEKVDQQSVPQCQGVESSAIDEDHGFSSLETQTTRRSHGSNSECNLKGLERRYHSLYLKAFEVTLLLENLLARKNASQVKWQQSISSIFPSRHATLA